MFITTDSVELINTALVAVGVSNSWLLNPESLMIIPVYILFIILALKGFKIFNEKVIFKNIDLNGNIYIFVYLKMIDILLNSMYLLIIVFCIYTITF